MRAMMKSRRKHILISVPMLTFQHRQGLEGALQYIKEHKASSWNTHLEIESLGVPSPLNLDSRTCDGIIAYVSDENARKRILAAQVPAVLYEPFRPASEIKKDRRGNATFMVNDFVAEGRAAARYFLERHFQNFAYVGSTVHRTLPCMQRQAGFSQEIRQHGFRCLSYPRRMPRRHPASNHGDHLRLAVWLRTLPQRTGVFCTRDVRALDIINAGRAIGLDIPNHVSILGFGNDELICGTCTPQLSSMSSNVHDLGYKAAHLLDRLMSGCGEHVVIHRPSLDIVTRTSTDTNAISDPFVSKALTWIATHLSESPTSEAVADGISYSLKTLQKRFRAALGHPLGAEIRRQKVARAIDQLRTTDDDLSQIADTCGFSDASHLCLRIKEATGLTPNAFRVSTEQISG